MIKALIFDQGGVIVHGGSLKEICEIYSKEFTIPLDKVKDIVKKYWKLTRISEISDEDFWIELKKNLNIKEDNNYLRNRWFREFYLEKNVFNLINNLRRRYKLCLLSNITKDMFEYTDKKFNTSKNFDFVVLSYEERLAKPDLRIYETALKKIGVKAQEAVFVDDNFGNIKAAEELGMKAIYFTDFNNFRKDLLRLIKF